MFHELYFNNRIRDEWFSRKKENLCIRYYARDNKAVEFTSTEDLRGCVASSFYIAFSVVEVSLYILAFLESAA